jgi:hypothetical protein
VVWHLRSTLQERSCHRHMQDSLPAGLASLCREESDPLGRDERFPSARQPEALAQRGMFTSSIKTIDLVLGRLNLC